MITVDDTIRPASRFMFMFCHDVLQLVFWASMKIRCSTHAMAFLAVSNLISQVHARVWTVQYICVMLFKFWTTSSSCDEQSFVNPINMVVIRPLKSKESVDLVAGVLFCNNLTTLETDIEQGAREVLTRKELHTILIVVSDFYES